MQKIMIATLLIFTSIFTTHSMMNETAPLPENTTNNLLNSPVRLRKNHIHQMINAAKNNDSVQFANLLTNAAQNNHADVLEPVTYILPNEILLTCYKCTSKLLPYAMAVYAGDKETIDQAKIKYLKKPQDKDSLSLLHLTTRHNHPISIGELLLAQDSSLLNAQDAMGATPLLYAAFSNNIPMCEYLLSFNEIQPDIANTNGWTPLTIAKELGHNDIIALLTNHQNQQNNNQTL